MGLQGQGPDPRTWRTDATHLDGLPTPAIITDARGLIVYCNAAAELVLERPSAHLIGARFLDELVPDSYYGATAEIFEKVTAGRTWTGQMPGYAGETIKIFDLSVSPMWDRGDFAGALLLGFEADGAAQSAAHRDRLAERLAGLTRVTAELVTAGDADQVTRIITSHAADAAGATVASVMRVGDDGSLELVGISGADDSVAARWKTLPITISSPATDAVRTGRRVTLSGRQAIEEHYPDLETLASGERSLLSLPLNVGPRTIGVINLSFPGLRSFDRAESEFLGILADTCAQALERISAVEQAAIRATQLRFLTEASAELASSLDYQATLRKVAWLGVPEFADWCSISLLEDGDLRTLAVAHIDPAKVAFAEELQRRYPTDPSDPHGAWNVVRTRRSELIPVITDDLLVASARDEEHLRLARELNLRSAVSAPLIAHGKVLGVMTWVSADEGRLFGEEDLAFVEDLAQRAAVAIDNAQLHSETREAAVRLQRAVLPERLPTMRGWEIASYYSPSGRTEVGGDFYDVLPLGEDVALFVGDVMGRGVSAAAAMAQMRAAVRSYLAIDPAPEIVASRLDMMFEAYGYDQLVTLVYVLADAKRGELRIVNAGHPPPVLLRADGRMETLSQEVTAPLGLGGQHRTEFRVPFANRDTLLLYTDGLIERRDEDIDVGQNRLTSRCSALMKKDLDSCLEQLVIDVRDHTREDDVAALAARWHFRD